MVRIAVVDDDENFLDVVGYVLAERGWELLPLPGGVSALERIGAEQPDVLLLDLRLPGQHSGWEILQELRANPATRAIPIIICSAAVGHLDDKRDWLAEQGISVLPKPFELDDFYLLVERALSGSGEHGQMAQPWQRTSSLTP